MNVNTKDAERLMKRCQIGVGGRNALEAAHDIMAECYGTIGALVQERDRLLAKASWPGGFDEFIGSLHDAGWRGIHDAQHEHIRAVYDKRT